MADHIRLIPGGRSPGSQKDGFRAVPAALLVAVGDGDRAAIAELYDRFGGLVEGVLANTLGADSELPDLLHEAFIRIIGGVSRVRDPAAVPAWITRVAVCTAIDCLRRRKRQRWLFFMAPDRIASPEVPGLDEEAREGLRCTREILDSLPVGERVAFTLRVISQMEIKDVAAACGCSLATAKRRLARAERLFLPLARRHPVLREWIEGGSRWGGVDHD